MDGRSSAVLAVLLVAAIIIAVAAFVMLSSEEGNSGGSGSQEMDPAEPDVPESPYPVGISFDPSTGTLSSSESIHWIVVDQLKRHIDKTKESYDGKVLRLTSGFYSVTVGDSTFSVVVDGEVSKTLSWDYYSGGALHRISVTYEIDISDLAEAMAENREWNSSSSYQFKDLPRLVYVNDTVRSIVSQLETAYLNLGGSLQDRQSYADFLVSLAQCGIKYPDWSYVYDENGNPVLEYDLITGNMVQATSTDYDIWGRSEYWSNSLETLFFGVGDCEDSAALACTLLKAAGYRTAMLGGSGHVMAGLSLDSFDDDSTGKWATVPSSGLYKVCTGKSLINDDGTAYYGIETTKGQAPVGYVMSGQADLIGTEMMSGGVAGFYAVP